MALLVLGVLAAIYSLPATLDSIWRFTLIGGFGVPIAYKLQIIHGVLLLGFGGAAGLYAFNEVLSTYVSYNSALLINVLKVVVPIELLET